MDCGDYRNASLEGKRRILGLGKMMTVVRLAQRRTLGRC